MKKLLLLIAVLVLSISLVSATANIYYTAENAQNFNALAYNCGNANCSQVADFSGSLSSLTTNGQLKVSFPTQLASQYGYALYFTTPGYFPKVVLANWAGDGTTTRSFSFNKGDVCAAKVDELTVLNDVMENVPLTIVTEASLDATTESAFSLTNHPVKYVPASLKDYYSSDVRVTLTIKNSNGNAVKSQFKDLKLFAGEKTRLEFDWTPQTAGDYTVEVSSEVKDDQCTSTTKQTTSKVLKVLNQAPRNMCYSLLNNLDVKTDNNQATFNVNAKSYYANDFLFTDSRYKLESIDTSLRWIVKDEKGNVVHDSTETNKNDKTVQLSAKNYNVQATASPQSQLCNGLQSLSETLTASFVIVAPRTFSVNFELVDPSGTHINGATISMAGVSKTTDNNGRASFTGLQNGDYPYTITHSNFKTLSGTIKVKDFDQNVGLTLDFTTPVANPLPPADAKYSATFSLFDKETGKEISDAKIVVAGAVGTTGSNGKIKFEGLKNGLHSYTISHANYEAKASSLTIAGSDVSVTLLLERTRGTAQKEDDKTPSSKEKGIRELFVSSIRIPNAFQVMPGEQVLVVVNSENRGNEELENLRVAAVIQDLGVIGTSELVDLDDEDKTAQRVVLNIPQNASKGVHYVRLTLDSNHLHRVLYREIEVV